jgi:uncharacterized membrane protein YccC
LAQGKASTCEAAWQADNAAMTRASEDDRKAKKTGRLAAALRENLRRRKAQERARAQTAVAAPPAVRPRESGDPGAKKS